MVYFSQLTNPFTLFFVFRLIIGGDSTGTYPFSEAINGEFLMFSVITCFPTRTWVGEIYLLTLSLKLPMTARF